MFNASLRLERDRRLWVGDDSSLSSDSDQNNNLSTKRYRRGPNLNTNQMATEARITSEATRMADKARIASSGAPALFGHTEYHHHEESSLMNSSKTGDGLETDFYRARKSSHVGTPVFNAFAMNGQQVQNQFMHHQMQMQLQNSNKRDFEYSASKPVHKKQKNKSISYRIQRAFSKMTSEHGKQDFVQHLLDNAAAHMSRDDYKTMLLKHIQ